jgi:hypothetical protein
MAFIGPRSGQGQHSANRYDVQGSGNNTRTVRSINLGPNDTGHWMMTVGYGPSEESGQYPNSDPDGWGGACYYNGNQVGDRLKGNEGTPRNYRRGSGGSWTIYHSSGNANFEWRMNSQWADGDNDGGGYRGYCYVSIHKLGGNT